MNRKGYVAKLFISVLLFLSTVMILFNSLFQTTHDPYIPSELKFNFTVMSSVEDIKKECFKIIQTKNAPEMSPYPRLNLRNVNYPSVTNRSTLSPLLLYSAVPKTGSSLFDKIMKIISLPRRDLVVKGRRTMVMKQGKIKDNFTF